MPLISLEVYRHLFTNEAAMAEFADVLERATKEDDRPLVIFHYRQIATVLSPRASKQISLSMKSTAGSQVAWRPPRTPNPEPRL